MANLHLILIVAAFICAVLAMVGVPSGRYNMVGASLACWFLSMLVG
jgi:hypothetical protein